MVTAGGGSVAGGFAGASHGTISESYATGNVPSGIAVQHLQNEAGGFAGGVAGGQVSQSFASGAVNETGSPTVPSRSAVSPGSSISAFVTNCLFDRPVTVSGSTLNYAGGFIRREFSLRRNQCVRDGAVSASGDPAGLVGTTEARSPTATGRGDHRPSAVGYHVGEVGDNVVGIVDRRASVPSSNRPCRFRLHQHLGRSRRRRRNFYPELYGASHVLNATANDVSSVYGTFPVYTVTLYGLQGGDNFVQPSSNPFGNVIFFDPTGETTSTSGFYNVGSIGLDLPTGMLPARRAPIG